MARLEPFKLNVPADGQTGDPLTVIDLGDKYVQADGAIAEGSLIIEGKLGGASSWKTLATLDDTTTGIPTITEGVEVVRVRNDGVAEPPEVFLSGWSRRSE